MAEIFAEAQVPYAKIMGCAQFGTMRAASRRASSGAITAIISSMYCTYNTIFFKIQFELYYLHFINIIYNLLIKDNLKKLFYASGPGAGNFGKTG